MQNRKKARAKLESQPEDLSSLKSVLKASNLDCECDSLNITAEWLQEAVPQFCQSFFRSIGLKRGSELEFCEVSLQSAGAIISSITP